MATCNLSRTAFAAALGVSLGLIGAAAWAGDAAAAANETGDTIPAGPLGDAVNRGRDLLTRTRVLLPAYVGSRLNCTSCHIDGGRRPSALPWTGVLADYPQYRPREARVLTIEDRVNECFKRSLNGKSLPADGEGMRDIVSYFAWLSRGTPIGRAKTKESGFLSARPADKKAGAVLYAQRCVRCHGADGAGLTGPDDDPDGEIPPLWGPQSFNVAAGMARQRTAEAFIRSSMPQGAEATLTEQQARDVAAFVINQPHPDFAAKAADWPKGGKPDDARY